MKTFDELWKFVNRNGSIVQEYSELEYVFNLIKDCESYLEIGSAEGSSLYVLSHALKPLSQITYIDLGEPHTFFQREENLAQVPNPICEVLTDSHSPSAVTLATSKAPYDVVFIDAGHTYEDVILDAMNYGHMARKFILFHDVQLPDVRRAFDWYCRRVKAQSISTFIKSETYGYGIICL